MLHVKREVAPICRRLPSFKPFKQDEQSDLADALDFSGKHLLALLEIGLPQRATNFQSVDVTVLVPHRNRHVGPLVLVAQLPGRTTRTSAAHVPIRQSHEQRLCRHPGYPPTTSSGTFDPEGRHRSCGSPATSVKDISARPELLRNAGLPGTADGRNQRLARLCWRIGNCSNSHPPGLACTR